MAALLSLAAILLHAFLASQDCRTGDEAFLRAAFAFTKTAFGTFHRDLREELSAIASACLRDVTLGPRLEPLRSLPSLNSPRTFLTFALAFITTPSSVHGLH